MLNDQVKAFLANPNHSKFKKSYLNALLERASEFRAVKQMDLAGELEKKALAWVEKQLKPLHKNSSEEKSVALNNQVSKEYFAKELEWVGARLNSHRQKIPRIEFEKFDARLNALKRRLEHLIYDDLNELIDIRVDLQERLHQSLRAIKVQKSALFKKAVFKEGHQDTVVSHYNDSATLKNLFAQISESDPIWVADFLKLYGDMFGLKENLMPFAKF